MDPAREVNRVYVCNCFGVTEEQVKKHAEGGACTPRQIASACKAGTDCGSCVRRIQALLGRGACPRRDLVDQGEPAVALVPEAELPKIPGIPGAPVPGREELPEAA
ncbi:MULTISPECIES: (2Fe-2S)-binding protein [Streptomyces]|uniref:Bacterioferritin-associated ferredoxin n=1 Tax=Streptomyces alboflavus TaxID=67267 RepID=A0A1Z1W917_9ACTN|nr:(2Fe-2S)-binding protein [Streptomyces alboflavus]ARX82906.1 putative Nitrogen fixation protein NifU [Streptomyces alboflavus]